ncbi:TetR/AcrR family transcriptional regulator [Mycolicibacterium sp. 3033]|nr:TetR/AcrR family transcriptional regulator [Mycolicibacterium aurantiacum]
MPTTRRRGAELDAAIKSAVMELLAAHGPDAVTMEAVAAAARTSKPVLYRRWADRRALLRDTLIEVASASIPTADTGSFRTDMLTVLRGWAALFAGPQGPLMRSIVMAVTADPELAETFHADVIGSRKADMTSLLRRGMARGDVRADIPIGVIRELGQSVLWHHLLITGDPIDDELVLTLVDEVILPLTAPTTVRS